MMQQFTMCLLSLRMDSVFILGGWNRVRVWSMHAFIELMVLCVLRGVDINTLYMNVNSPVFSQRQEEGMLLNLP